MKDIWQSLAESFDITLPRMSAIALKEDDYDLGYYAPSPDGRIGYHFLDTNLSLYNQDRYTFEIYFAAYEYPNLCGAPGKTRYIFSEQTYLPGRISHSFHFPNSALAGTEMLSSAHPGSLIWEFDLCNTSVGLNDPKGLYRYSKRIYSVFMSHDGFNATYDGNTICIELKNHKYFIACNSPVKIAVFDNELDAYEAMGENFSENHGFGRVMIIETKLDIENNECKKLHFGLSHHSLEDALIAASVTDSTSLLRNKWNDWFSSLPSVTFKSEDERKLYYKCWWTIRLNFCNYPGWGFNVLESLPVYKGIWQWAIPAVEWYSSQDSEHASKWIRSAMDILLRAQREDGFITHAAYLHEDNPGSSWMDRGIIQNPQLPGTALRYFNVCGDIESLKRWYKPLKDYYGYLCRNFDVCHENLHLWALHSSYDTGLDTFPAFQEVTYGIDGNEPTEYCYGSILSAERYHYEKSMGKLASLTGLDDPDYWEGEAEKTKEAINRILWDDDKKWYGALKQNGELDTRIGIDGLFPLIYGLADENKLQSAEPQFSRLIGEFGIRTCAKGEPGFFSDIYWRGPCWPKSCSLAVSVAKNYYPHLLDDVFASVLRANLKYPNIWECIDVDSGKLARSNVGFYCTPCMSSNVGAGELLGAIYLYHGFDMFGTDSKLPLTEMTNYHYRSLRITIKEDSDSFIIRASAAEENENDVLFVLPDGKETLLHLKGGETYSVSRNVNSK